MDQVLTTAITQIAAKQGYVLERPITGRDRYEYAIVSKDSRSYFLKVGHNRRPDIDEPLFLYNLQREVWWAQLVTALHTQQSWPFTSPTVTATNIVADDVANEEIGWIIFEYELGTPLSGRSIWDVTTIDKTWQPAQINQFHQVIPQLVATLAALNTITPALVTQLGIKVVPAPPHPPHQELSLSPEVQEFVIQQPVLESQLREHALSLVAVTDPTLPQVLGQGDFEVSHLFILPDGTVVISDNEFAGWYPQHDSLSYCVHRLWANRQRPDLAQALLSYYVQHQVPAADRNQFWQDFTRLMVPRLLRGMYYDYTRRQLLLDHQNHQLRRQLLGYLLNQQFDKLLS